MAENTFSQRYADADSNTAGAFAFDTISSVDYAVSKLAFGDADTITRVTSSAGLPVAQQGTWTVAVASAQTIAVTNAGTFAVQASQAGTWNITNISGTVSLPTGASTLAEQQSQTTHLATVAGAVAGTEMQVDVVAALPAGSNTIGAVNLAQYTPSSGRLPVDGSGVTQPVSGTVTVAQGTAASLNATVVGTGTFAVQAAQSGTWNVGTVTTVSAVTAITNSLPAGTNYIGKTRLTDGTNDVTLLNLTGSKPVPVAIVDGDGDQLTAFGGGTQYTEGDTSSSIVGTAILWEDAANTLATVSAGSPLPVAIISGAGSGGTAQDDEASFTAGTTPGTPAMGAYQATPGTLSDGELGIVGLTASRELKVKHTDAIGVTDNSGSLTVDAPVTTPVFVRLSDGTDPLATLPVSLASVPAHHVTNAGTFAVQVDGTALTRLTDIETNTDALAVVGGGTEATALRVTLANDSTGVVSVDDNGGSLTVDGTVAATQSGTWNVTNISGTVSLPTGAATESTLSTLNGKVTACNTGAVVVSSGSITANAGTNLNTSALALETGGNLAAAATALQLIDDTVFADSASFTAASSKVLTMGAVVSDSPALVAGGQAGIPRMTTDRKLIVSPVESHNNYLSGTASATGTGDTSIIAAQGTDTYILVTTLIVFNSSDTDTHVTIKSGSTARMVVPAPAKAGAVVSLPVPLMLAVNQALNFASAAGVTTMHVSAVGAKITLSA
jgi:hypothetical protein